MQQWCHKLTISSRSRAAHAFLNHLGTFAKTVRVFLQGIGEVTEKDRTAMKEKWESDMLTTDDMDDMDEEPYFDYGYDSDGPFNDAPFMYRMKQTKVGPDGEPIGIMPRLVKVRDILPNSRR